MSLNLKLGADWAANAKSLFLDDETGSAPPGGWGAGTNPTIASVQTAQVVITRPDLTILAPINVYPTLPNTDGIAFEATNQALGYGTGPIVDGPYNFNYTVTGLFNSEPYTVNYNRTKFLYPSVCCCVSRMAAKVRAQGKKCKDKDREAFSDAWDLLELLKDAVKCGNMTEANEFLLQLQTICAANDCGCH